MSSRHGTEFLGGIGSGNFSTSNMPSCFLRLFEYSKLP